MLRCCASKLFRCAVFLALTWLPAPVALAQKDAGKAPIWAPDTCLKVKTIRHVQPSPDGKRVVYTVMETHLQSDQVFSTASFIANVDGSNAIRIGRKNGWVDQPQWSPDGKWIAFVDAGLCRLRPDGSDAERLTPEGFHPQSFQWAPDSNYIAFSHTCHGSKDKPAAPLERGGQEDVANDQLFVVSMSRNGAGHYPVSKLTAGDYHVARTAGSFAWAPDGKAIAYTRNRSSHFEDWRTSGVWLIDIASGEQRALATSEAALSNPVFSPDGQLIACVVDKAPVRWTHVAGIHVYPVKGGTPQKLAATWNERPTLVGWSEDGCKILYAEQHKTAVRLFALPLKGDPVPLSPEGAVLSHLNLNATRTMIGFAMEKMTQPAEAYVSKLDAFDPVQSSAVNEELRKLPLPKTEVIHWKGPDGLEIEGLLTYPAHYEPGKRYPMVLEIHGGPAGLYSQEFLGNPTPYAVAVFAERGFAVLRCNPRGSSGYGAKFREANYKDWGGKDFQDLMLGVDHVVALGVADPKRLGIMGWSYGGYMTAWAIAHTKHFKAASVGAGITNLVSFSGTTDLSSFLVSYLGGEHWDLPGVYEKHSPISHVKSVTAATLIQHGRNDERVPVSQAVELYSALKRLGCTAQMTVYPMSGHHLVGDELLHGLEQNLAWMEKYVK